MPVFSAKHRLFSTKNIRSTFLRYKWKQKTTIPCGMVVKKYYIFDIT